MPAVVAAPVPAFATGGPEALRAVGNLSGAVLMGLAVAALWRTGRLPGLPRADRRLWISLAAALSCYGLGMVADFVLAAAHALLGTPPAAVAVNVVFPVAGLVTVVAMFQYPTTTRTAAERLTVGMDANIVLLAGGVFIWHFGLSPYWEPSHGWGALLTTLVQPLLALLTGFAMLKITFVGARVFTRTALLCFGACIGISAAAVGLASMAGGRDYVVLGLGSVLSEMLVAIGCRLQFRATAAARVRPPPRPGRRRVLAVLPYVASAASYLLLVVVLRPILDWRHWGVLVGIGLLLVAVSARQALSLRENGRLLARNRQLTEQLRRQAWFDELTGLANRAHYGTALRDALDRAGRADTRTALLLIDLDDFKIVNDTLGHLAGDALLREVARRLTTQVRGGDTVCRLGGDEFVVIAEGTDEASAAMLADRLVRSLTEPVRIGEHTVAVSASVGITLTAGAAADPGDLLRDADVAMYAAKAAGKGGWCLAGAAEAAPTAA